MGPKLVLIGILSSAIGCSTLQNVSGNFSDIGLTGDFKNPRPKRVYGGVRLAAKTGWEYVRYTSPDGAELFAVPEGLAIWVIDVPLSFVGDTLTLPITVPAEIDYAVDEYYFPDRGAVANTCDDGP